MILWPIPPGAAPRKCHKCPRMIYDVLNEKSGKSMPLTIEPTYTGKDGVAIETGTRAPTDTEPGQGFNHFSDCPEAASFRAPPPVTLIMKRDGKDVTRDKECTCGVRFTQSRINPEWLNDPARKADRRRLLPYFEVTDEREVYMPLNCPRCERQALTPPRYG